jgi:hypothetical protein
MPASFYSAAGCGCIFSYAERRRTRRACAPAAFMPTGSAPNGSPPACSRNHHGPRRVVPAEPNGARRGIRAQRQPRSCSPSSMAAAGALPAAPARDRVRRGRPSAMGRLLGRSAPHTTSEGEVPQSSPSALPSEEVRQSGERRRPVRRCRMPRPACHSAAAFPCPRRRRHRATPALSSRAERCSCTLHRALHAAAQRPCRYEHARLAWLRSCAVPGAAPLRRLPVRVRHGWSAAPRQRAGRKGALLHEVLKLGRSSAAAKSQREPREARRRRAASVCGRCRRG